MRSADAAVPFDAALFRGAEQARNGNGRNIKIEWRATLEDEAVEEEYGGGGGGREEGNRGKLVSSL